MPIVQKKFRNGSESHLKLQANVQEFFFLTLHTNIFQSVGSNFMKFLTSDLKQIKYKIL